MEMYFSSGKKRLALDHANKRYCTDYLRLGGWKSYIKTNSAGIKELTEWAKLNGYVEVDYI